MVLILFLSLGAAALMVAHAVSNTARLQAVLKTKTVQNHFPIALQVLCVAVQAGELMRVVEHASPVNIVAALLILALVVAVRPGSKLPHD